MVCPAAIARLEEDDSEALEDKAVLKRKKISCPQPKCTFPHTLVVDRANASSTRGGGGFAMAMARGIGKGDRHAYAGIFWWVIPNSAFFPGTGKKNSEKF